MVSRSKQHEYGELPGTNMVEYPFPLRRGMTVRIVLPRDLVKTDVQRITRFLESLVNGV